MLIPVILIDFDKVTNLYKSTVFTASLDVRLLELLGSSTLPSSTTCTMQRVQLESPDTRASLSRHHFEAEGTE